MTVVSSTPNSAADTASNPGGAAGYNPAMDAGGTTTTPAVSSNFTPPSGNMPISLPQQYENLPINEAVAPYTVGQGTKRPDLTRLSDLVKLAAAIAQGSNLGGFSKSLLDDVFGKAGISGHDQENLKKSSIRYGLRVDLADLTAKFDPFAKPQLDKASQVSPEVVAKVNKAIWADITNHLSQIGVSLPPDAQAPPNAYNMMNKLTALGNLPVGSQAVAALGRQGFNTQGVSSVKSLVASHDVQGQFQKGAPGLQVPGTSGATGAQVWDGFVSQWNDPNAKAPDGQPFKQEMYTQLVDAGLLDPTSNPTINDVANAYQNLIQQASQGNVSVSAQLAKLMEQNPNSGTGALSNVARQEVQDQLAQWGVPATPTLMNQLVNSVMQSGVTSPYEVQRIADATVENYGKNNVANLYGPAAGAAAARGETMAQAASSYQQVAANLLGIPTTDLALNDPSGKWMGWTQGGTNPDGSMTLQEWAGKLMNDPQYGYQNSSFHQKQEASGANALLQLFGKVPQANPFSDVLTTSSAIPSA